jgi:hypothetical protein
MLDEATFLTIDTLSSIAIIVGIAVTALYGLISIQIRMREHRISAKKQQMEIEIMRDSLERRIYDMNDRLTSDPKRWRDVNNLVVEGAINLPYPDSLGSEINMGRASGRLPRSPIKSANSIRFLEDIGVNPSDVEVRRDKVFVLTPFNKIFDDTFDSIRIVGSKLGLQISRGDEKFLEGNLLRHIVTEILSSTIVVANIDGRNPNVFYELGIAQALGKRVIVVTSKIKEVPFDLRNHRLVVWNSRAALETGLLESFARLGLDVDGDQTLPTDSRRKT